MISKWKKVKVGELGEVVTGKTPKTSIPENYGGTVPFLTPSDDMSVKYVTKTARSLSSKGLDEVKKKVLPPNSICVSCIGSDLGKVVMTTEATVTNQQINSVVVDTSLFDPSFIYYAMIILGRQLNFIGKTSTAVPIVNKASFSSYEILCPSLEMQRKIARILSLLDNKISLNQKINDNLEQQAQTLFKSWFVDGTINGAEIPLYEFAEYINGTSFKKDEYSQSGLPIIKIAELKNGITDSTQYFSGKKDEKYLVKNGDILFSWSGNPDTSIDIFVWACGNAILNQHTFNVRSKHRWFVYLLLKYFKPQFSRIASNKQTTGLGHVTVADLKRLTFIYDKVGIEEFDSLVSPMMEKVYSNMLENHRLSEMRDTLLPKLMSGEIDVEGIQL